MGLFMGTKPQGGGYYYLMVLDGESHINIYRASTTSPNNWTLEHDDFASGRKVQAGLVDMAVDEDGDIYVPFIEGSTSEIEVWSDADGFIETDSFSIRSSPI